MADNKELRSPQDATRIALTEDYEVAYWTDKFDVTKDELSETVHAVGHSAEAVSAYLKR